MKKHTIYKIFLPIFVGCVLFSFGLAAQTQEWLSTYNGTDNQTDQANLIYVDTLGNSYVAGATYDTTGGAAQHIAVVKYDPNGNQLWAAISENDGGSFAYGMSVDAGGNVFVTGYSDSYTLGHFIVVKFDSLGAFKWVQYPGTVTGFLDNGIAIASDANYVYVTGYVTQTGYPPATNYRTVKLDKATGTTQSGWPKDYNGIGNSNDNASAIAVTPEGHVFVTGSSVNSSGNKDYVTIGYDSSGAVLAGWPKTFDGLADLDDVPVQIVVTGSVVAVTGNCNDSGYVAGDIGTILYDLSGNVIPGWPQVYNGPGNGWDGVGYNYFGGVLKPMALDPSGNVYVGGWSTNDSGNYDMVIFKYNSAGVTQAGFPVIYDNGGNDDILRGLVLDASNDICVTGYTAPHNTSNGDCITIEYDNAGNLMGGWPVIYNGTGNGDDQGVAITTLGSDIWVTGYTTGAGTFDDYLTIKYSNSNPTVGVKNLAADATGVTVYPNPSSGKFTIVSKEAESLLTITNILGEVIFESEITAPNTYIDLSGQAKGIYFYKVIADGNSIFQGKLILQ